MWRAPSWAPWCLGLLESIGPNLFLDGLGIPTPSQLKDAIAFIILVFILIFRPSGILGEADHRDQGLEEPAMQKQPSIWVAAIRNGLIGGAVSLLLCLVGMVMQFSERDII